MQPVPSQPSLASDTSSLPRSASQFFKSSEKPLSRSYTAQAFADAQTPLIVNIDSQKDVARNDKYDRGEERENQSNKKDGESGPVDRVVASYKTAVLSNRLQISALSEAIERENQRLETRSQLASAKAELELELTHKGKELELARSSLAAVQLETNSLSIEQEAVVARTNALKETRLRLTQQVCELTECVKHLKVAQTTAEARLSELHTLHRHYEESQDLTIQQIARLHTTVKNEADLSCDLTFELDRKKDQESELAREVEELEAMIEELEGEQNPTQEQRVKQAEEVCESIRSEIRSVERQLGEAAASVEVREQTASYLKQESEHAAKLLQSHHLRRQSALHPATLLPQGLLALLLGVLASFLLSRISTSLEVY